MDTHEQLMKLFREYFEANQKWERQKTHVAGVRCRNLLAEIRIVARKRRAEIQEIRHVKIKEYIESQSKAKDDDKA